ncbi:hypothetical protein SDC9_80550 [bioreactor metagenome]|uniref:Uncharacterized protein n=1 Tax=bioreactor metagenome TaxID=1076179 RepID=A0A644Z0A3_9ZZZZ
MRRQKHRPAHRLRVARRMQQSNAAAIAVPQKPYWIIQAQRVSQRGQHLVGLLVHEVRLPVLITCARRGPAITGPRIDQPAQPRGIAHLLRKILPHVDGAQPLVQKDHRALRRFCLQPAMRRKPLVFHLHIALAPVQVHGMAATDWRLIECSGGQHRMLPCAHAVRSRRRKRWILPVAVLGSSSTNSIKRGYL